MARRSILAVVWVLLAACAVSGPETSRPHLLLVTSDALRADHLSLNGYARATSPALDAFAGTAWHFTDAVTVIPKTGPAFATLFTGRHPQEHGVRSNFEAIPESLPVLAEHLRAAGYRTAAFVGNPVLRPGKGYARGFDYYQLFDGKHADGVHAVNQAFFAWADAAWEEPSFVWIHYMDPHGPYVPPASLERLFLDDALARDDRRVPLEAEVRPGANPNKVLGAIPAYQQREGEDRAAVYVARYDAEIRNMDEGFGRLLAFLRERGLYDPSAIVFTSDHGESLGEHDFWFEHGWFAYEPGLRVPLIYKKPGQIDGGIVDRQVSSLDFLPTLLGLAGAAGGGQGPGLNSGETAGSRDALLIESSDRYPDKYHGLRVSGWKYLVREGDGAEELYDLRADPAELQNLADREPDRRTAMREAFTDAMNRAREAAVPQAVGLPDDPATLERLRSLGYLD